MNGVQEENNFNGEETWNRKSVCGYASMMVGRNFLKLTEAA